MPKRKDVEVEDFGTIEGSSKVDVRRWAANVVSWDGILPLTILLVSAALKAVFANQPRVVEYSLVSLAVLACLIRLNIGVNQIQGNYCGPRVRMVQFVVFMICLLLWGLLEFVFMLVPLDKLFVAKEDQVVWAILFSLYFAGMTFAWYPGSSK